jgi:hypothetical protein
MGGRGKGVWTPFDDSTSARDFQSAWLNFTPGLKARPWSVQATTSDGIECAWACDARGRARTFATEEAARAYCESAATAPVIVNYGEGTGPGGVYVRNSPDVQGGDWAWSEGSKVRQENLAGRGVHPRGAVVLFEMDFEKRFGRGPTVGEVEIFKAGLNRGG